MSPDAALFHQHVQSAEFQICVDAGRWGLHDENPLYLLWPKVVVWIQAVPKAGFPDRYYFQFDLAGYSSQAPTACPWDIVTNGRLPNDLWPRGNKFVSNTFNFVWNPNALYAPCDRIAMQGHDAWRTEFPDLWWQPSFRVNIYLNFLHHLLNSSDYANS